MGDRLEDRLTQLEDRLTQLGGICMSLLDDENIIAENTDKRLELEQQLKQSIQRLIDSFNMSTDHGKFYI